MEKSMKTRRHLSTILILILCLGFGALFTLSGITAAQGPSDSFSLDNPYTGGSYQYTGQLETQSEGAGGSDPASVVEEAYRDAGYDFVALAGHSALVPDPGVAGILHISDCEEHFADYGHIVAVDIQALVPLDADPQEALDDIIAQGGVAIMAHPNFSGASWTNEELTTLTGYHAVEIKNSYVIHQEGEANGTAIAKWDMLLSAGRRVWAVGTDDAHDIVIDGGIFDTYAVRVFSQLAAAEQEDLSSALKNGNFYTVTGADGPVVEQVSTLGTTVSVTLADVASTYTVSWYGHNGALLETNSGVDTEASYTATGTENYIRAEVVRGDDGERAWLNPVFVIGGEIPTDTPTPTATDITPTPDPTPTPTPNPGGLPIVYLAEDFESYSAGQNPPDWLDQDSSFASGDYFQVASLEGNKVFQAIDGGYRYTHYNGDGALIWQDYEYSGRVRFGQTSDGISLTFYSHVPENQDRYYQLLRYSGETGFRIHAHGTDITDGITSVELGVKSDTWYRFRVRAQTASDRVRIVAKVWEDGQPEPTDWQIDCYDGNTTRITEGAVGVWSEGSGTRAVDDLYVRSLHAVPWSGFPLSLYNVQIPSFAAVKSAGMDWVHQYDSIQSEGEAITYLQAAESAGLEVVQNMPADYLTYPEAFWADRIDALSPYDTLSVWYLPEEPTDHGSVEVLHDLVRLRDPDSRPAGTYFANLLALDGWCDVMDILFVGAYPEYSGEPRVSMMARLDIAQEACPGLPIVGVPMLFDTNYDGTGDYPTPHEARADAYTALIAGASGLQWYSYELGQNVPDLWQAVQDIVGEMNSLEAVITEPDSSSPATVQILSGPVQSPETSGRSYDSIQFVQKENLGEQYLFVVNVAEDTVEARFSGLPGSAVHAVVLFEDRSVPITGGAFSDTFAAADVHVYKVTATNEPPQAVDDTDSTDEDTAIIINVLDNDRDPEWMPLTVGAVGTPNLGTASTDGSTVTYTPANRTSDYTAVFTYMASDGSLSDTATVTVQVSADNDPPDAVDDMDSTDEQTAVTIAVLANDTDPDTDDTLTVEAVGIPNLGTATTNGTTITYTPANRLVDYTAVFTYTAGDGAVSDTATVTVHISADNDAPEAVNDTGSTDEDTPITVTVLSNDSDPEGMSLVVGTVGTPNLGTATTNGTTVTYTPVNRSADYTAVFTYTASDGSLSDIGTVTINVSADNELPDAEDDVDSTVEEAPITIAVLSNDSDPDTDDTLSVAAVGVPNLGNASTNGTMITYTPVNRTVDYTAVFTYTASDGDLSDTATVTVLVSADNDPPDAVHDTRSTAEDTAKTIAVLDNDSDPEGMPLSVGTVGVPNLGGVTTDGTTVVYTPVNLSADYTAVFTYTASDGELSDTATVTVLVSADNDPPEAADDLRTTNEDTPITVYVLSNDSDPDTNDTLSVALVGTPNLGTASTDGTAIVYIPANQSASYTAVFTYTASDGTLNDTATVRILVSADNEPPDAVGDTRVTDEDTPITIAVLSNDSDPDTNDTLSVAGVGVPGLGTATTDGTAVTYTPANRSADYTVVFTYTISDGLLNDTATITIIVSADNDAPEARDDTDSTDEHTLLTINVLGNDDDPDTDDTLVIGAVGIPNLGMATTDGTTVTYTPVNQMLDYIAVLTYTISDGSLSDTATVTINVSADNDPPTISDIPDQRTTVGVTAGPIPFLVEDAETPADSLVLTVASSNLALIPPSSIVLGGSGPNRTVTVTPTVGLVDTATITVTVSDGERTASDAFELTTVPTKVYLPMIFSSHAP
jgi:hypothetical protein